MAAAPSSRFADPHGGEGRDHHIAERHIVKTDNGNILRQPEAAFPEGLHGGGGNDVVIRKISIRQLRLRIQNRQHILIAFLGRRGNGVDVRDERC